MVALRFVAQVLESDVNSPLFAVPPSVAASPADVAYPALVAVPALVA
jgi:hypothetical protein